MAPRFPFRPWMIFVALAILGVAALLPALTPGSTTPTSDASHAEPHSIRMFFGEDASTQMLVAWGVESPVAQFIEYGSGIALDDRASALVLPFPDMQTRDPENCSLEGREGPLATSGCTDQAGVGFVATVRLVGLEPGTEYRYRVGAPGAWSPEGTFETAPRAFEEGLVFVAYGDTVPSTQLPSNAAYPRLNALAAASVGPDFTLHLGDLNYVDEAYTRHVEWWREWFVDQGPLMTQAPYMWALGNHELDVPEWRAYFGAMLPWWHEQFPVWSFRWGDVAVVSVEATFEHVNTTPTPALVLDAELAKHADAKWKIVTMHAGPYAAGYDAAGAIGGHGSACHVRAAYEPVFARHGVDLVLSGHDHNYQRSHAIDPETHAVTIGDASGAYSASDGVMYVVAGSGGKMAPADPATLAGPVPRRDCDTDLSWQSQFIVERMHVVVRQDADALHVEGRDYAGAVRDAFTLRP